MKKMCYLFLFIALLAPAEYVSAANTVLCVGTTTYPANANTQGATPTPNPIEPYLLTNVQNGKLQMTTVGTSQALQSVPGTWQQESAIDQNEPGVTVINGIFNIINGIMSGIEETFYNGILVNPNFQAAISAMMVLYITIYGIMIWFNLASYRTGEIIDRLFKIALVWAVTSGGGWIFFHQYIAYPVVNLMNGIITDFMVAGAAAQQFVAPPAGNMFDYSSTATTLLNPATMAALVSTMDLVFSLTFLAVILAHLSLPFGWIFVLIVMWGMVEFILLLIGAIVTYVKGVVGLLFLFALAPIFIAFILFGQTRRVFIGWVNQAFSFFLHPVLLFAFLSFYMVLMRAVLINLLFYGADGQPINYCWITWLHFFLFDVTWWRPINFNNPSGGQPSDWLAGNIGGNWWGPAPVSILQALFFVLIAHLGKNLCKFIEHIARDLSGGHGPGIVKDNDIGKWFANYVPGVKGRGIAQLAMDGASAGLSKGMKLYEGWSGKGAGMVGRRGIPGATIYSSAEGGSSASTTASTGASVKVTGSSSIPGISVSGTNNPGSGGG